ncbi:LOW QUALITY PROTEIN: hypothetical protein Cgig2_010288 [Carnegiea gigantea]|uniref:Uncharacterized protein n=1 Tax=Carnegiea gigantea TaxID=171969 RepID=A0A9Q1JLK6_9CARY|nr:LOW QUALITY PROTEIN: hypothetical protein Cgig2_010288 [Carnegiea gigantea]
MVIEEDVYMTLGLPKGPLMVIEAKNETNASTEKRGKNDRNNSEYEPLRTTENKKGKSDKSPEKGPEKEVIFENPFEKAVKKKTKNKENTNKNSSEQVPAKKHANNKDEEETASEDEDLNYEGQVIDDQRAKPNESKQYLQIVQQEKSLKSKEEFNEAQVEAVRSVGFASFLKMIKSFDPYAVHFRLFDVQKFQVTVQRIPNIRHTIGGGQILEIVRPSIDEEYEQVHTTWMKEGGLDQNTPELTWIPDFTLAKTDREKSFKRNFIIHLWIEEPLYSRSFLKNVKDVNKITFLNWCQFIVDKLIDAMGHYKESKAAKGLHFNLLFFLMAQVKPKSVKEGNGPTFNLELGLSQRKIQSPIAMSTSTADANISVATSTSVPHAKITGGKDDDHQEENNAPLTFTLRESTQANRDLSIKKVPYNKSKADEKSARQNIMPKMIIKIKKSIANGTKAPSPPATKHPTQQSKQTPLLKAQGMLQQQTSQSSSKRRQLEHSGMLNRVMVTKPKSPTRVSLLCRRVMAKKQQTYQLRNVK